MYRINFLEDGGKGIIPKLISFIDVARSEPEIADIASILYLSEGVLASLAIS